MRAMGCNGDTKSLRNDFKLMSTSILPKVLIFVQNSLIAIEQCVLLCEKGQAFSGETPWGENVRSYTHTHTHTYIRTTCDFGVFMKYVAIPQWLYTKRKGPLIPKLDFYFPQYDLWTVFKDPSIFMIMALGLCVKQP